MRRLGVIAALVLGAVGVLAIPSSALAVSDCTYASGTTVGPVTVYTSGGRTGDALVGACADTNLPVLDGGYAEVGNGSKGTYAIVDGSDTNTDPSGFSDGYVGLSNYESGASRDANCSDGPDQGASGSTNSGGCEGVDGVGWVLLPGAVPTPACGNTSGNDWANTTRDGCSIP